MPRFDFKLPTVPAISLPVVDWSQFTQLKARSSFVVSGAAALVVLVANSGFQTSSHSRNDAGEVASAVEAQTTEVAPAAAIVSEDPVASVEKKLESEIRKIPGVESLEREAGTHAIKITLNSDSFFQFGTANLEEKSEYSLKEIAGSLKSVLAKTMVEIEGYTDDSPILRQKKLYRSNWELSLARAASLVHIFEDVGFLKEKLKVTGYGDSRPVLPNRTPAGEAILSNLSKNRRIVLKVYADQVEESSKNAL